MLVYLLIAYLIWGKGDGIKLALPDWTPHAIRQLRQDAADTQTGLCGSDVPPRETMEDSTSPQLRKLAEYEMVCEAAFADDHMLFSPMPVTTDQAVQIGSTIALSLKEFDSYSVRPVVILEPVTLTGATIPTDTFRTGVYDAMMRTYFETLKARGVTDAMMGTWVPYPEANTPVWQTTNPDDFAAVISRIASLQKEYFPESKSSILLASQTYPDYDDAWQYGAYASLLPYVQAIPDGLIDSFGYQGFPWKPVAGKDGEVMDPAEFLRIDYAMEAATALGVRHIWFNTGTFGQAHTQNKKDEVTVDTARRARLLQGIHTQARTARDAGYEVAVHLFSEDKSSKSEGIDWSYWQPGQAAKSDATPVFRDFVRKTLADDMEIWLYDDDHHGARVESSQQPRVRARP